MGYAHSIQVRQWQKGRPMLLPARFATSTRLEKVGLGGFGSGTGDRVDRAKHRLAALRDFDGARVAVSPVVEAMAPVTRSMQRQASKHRGRTAAAVTAAAVTAAVATVAYVWWRSKDQPRPEQLYLGPSSWVPVLGVPPGQDHDEAGGSSATAAAEAPSPGIGGIERSEIGAPVAIEETVVDAADLGAMATASVEIEKAPDLVTKAGIVDAADESRTTAMDSIDIEVDGEDGSPITEDASSVGVKEPDGADAPGTRMIAPLSLGTIVDAVAGKPAAASTPRADEGSSRRRFVEPAAARRAPQTRARTTPRPAGQPLTQPPFTVPSSRPRLPGGWRSPLP